jgi:hypothetical protein
MSAEHVECVPVSVNISIRMLACSFRPRSIGSTYRDTFALLARRVKVATHQEKIILPDAGAASRRTGRTQRSDISWQGIPLPDDACPGTYRSQHTVYRQREFGRSAPAHPASGRGVSRYIPTGRGVSGHFPSRCSCVFQTQPCNLDAAVASGRSRDFWSQRVAS